jgi:repressor LexA
MIHSPNFYKVVIKTNGELMQRLTDAQTNLLNAITQLMQSLGVPPTVKELADALSIQPPSVHELLKRLEAKGYIRRKPRKARSLEILKSLAPSRSNLIAVPIIGTVAAGTPILALENRIGEVMVDASVVRGNCFALQVEGDSMIDADINDGDHVVVRQQPIAEHGDIVVAMLDDSAKVKRLFISDDHIELRPENKRLKPIQVGADDDLRIVGKVLHVCSKASPVMTKQEGGNVEIQPQGIH